MSFRESLALRSKRFSLSPPTLLPSSDLPPRSDETSTSSPTSPARASWERHHRCASNGSARVVAHDIPTYPTSALPRTAAASASFSGAAWHHVTVPAPSKRLKARRCTMRRGRRTPSRNC
ncbi:hypothetical protein CERSUDRAFT_100186 [Gelatoporia subvermispora B]|uniref:Uncharacterized protein n=1 Tax=Ceriporiopsis subvermispora (strain B) TaxID=914234 RepID=M2QYW4_CERS8|nr:hypothetical protein CERSUDRAFT_100186 [Gelatoporia subvermispora B]